MKIFFCFLILVAGCAHSKPFTCPDGSNVWIEASAQENAWAAHMSNETRGLAQCAKEASEEKAHDLVDAVFDK